jgi:prepilin-type N-terminal cleavage/methylation domain-containing protein
MKISIKAFYGKTSAAKNSSGFTIAELIIVIAIFSIITTVALLDQNRLNSGVLISNLAYETALAVREAQVYGVSVRNVGAASTGFASQYGAYFNMSSPEQIIVYQDKDNDAVFDVADAEAQYTYEFVNQRGNRIRALCLGVLTGPCTTNSPEKVDSLRILFRRPSLEAKFYAGDEGTPVSAGPAYIVVNNVDSDNCRVVIVEPTGQIRIEDSADSTHACE